MKILALEFSSTQRSVAVLNNRVEAIHEAVDAATGRSMQPFAAIESALRQAGVEREALDGIVVGLGPGSYAGIRVGIALAQGWQLGRNLKLLGISSVDCIAAQAVANGVAGTFHVVIDAQRGEFYLAGYAAIAERWQAVMPLRLATMSELRELERTGATLIGPEATRWFSTAQDVAPRAGMLARLAVGRTDFVTGEKLAPIYLREPTFVKAPPPRIY